MFRKASIAIFAFSILAIFAFFTFTANKAHATEESFCAAHKKSMEQIENHIRDIADANLSLAKHKGEFLQNFLDKTIERGSDDPKTLIQIAMLELEIFENQLNIQKYESEISQKSYFNNLKNPTARAIARENAEQTEECEKIQQIKDQAEANKQKSLMKS